MFLFIVIVLALFGILFIFLPAALLLILVKKKEYIQLSENQKYAGFWWRFLAGIIDLIILYIVIFILGFISGYIFLTDYMDVDTFFYTQWILNILSGLISLLYYVLFQKSSKQATPGMMIVGIKIYDEELQRVGFWRLTGRYFTTGLSNLILWIGFFMIGWTKRKQGLHDILARTIHLKKNK